LRFIHSHEIKTRQIDTQLCGRLQLKIAMETKKLDLSKQKQGGAPNFVHNMDATHMHMTVNLGAERDITS
jgi:DNA-directed RNA polymerase